MILQESVPYLKFKLQKYGLSLFEKPLRIAAIIRWIKRSEKEIDPQRELADWWVSGGFNINNDDTV